MDRERFDAAARAAGRGTTRRAALSALAAGLVAATLGRPAAASTGERRKRVKRCRRAGLRDTCERNPDCCKGLKCNRNKGHCVWRRKHGDRNHWCRRDRDCHKDLVCRKKVCREA